MNSLNPNSHLTAIVRTSLSYPARILLNQKKIGGRIKSGYSFNLEIENGILKNNIDGSAVARDLFEVLKSSATAKELMKNNYFKINLTKDFKLTMQNTKIEKEFTKKSK